MPEVTDPGHDEEPRAWNELRQLFGVLAFDRLVVFAIDNHCRWFDLPELFARIVGLRIPHRADRLDERIVLIGRRRNLPVLFSGPRDCLAEDGVFVEAGYQSSDVEVRAVGPE